MWNHLSTRKLGAVVFCAASFFALSQGEGVNEPAPTTALPSDKLSYVGYWEGRGVSFEMTQEGRVKYVKRKGTTSKSVSAPVRKFEGDNFQAGVWLLAEDFKVSQPPVFSDGAWTMTVNGVKLHRVR